MSRFNQFIHAAAALLAVISTSSASVIVDENTQSLADTTASPETFGFTHTGDLVYMVGGEQTGDLALVHQTSGNIRLTIAGQNFASAITGRPAVSSNGVVSFQCVGSGIDGIYARSTSGGQVVTVHGTSFGNAQGAPSVSPDGAITFLGEEGVYIRESLAGTTIITIAGQNFARMGRPSVNESHDIAVAVTIDDGSGNPPVDTVFVQHSSGAFHGTIDFGNDFRLTSAQPKIIDNQKGLLVAGMVTGSTGSPEEVLMLAEFDESSSVYSNPKELTRFTDGVNFDELSMSPDGNYYYGTRAGGTILMKGGPKIDLNPFAPESNGYEDPVVLLSAGDPLLGSTVASISISDGSAQLDGSVMFHATLSNGFSGLFLSTIPEPTTLFSVLGLTSIALLRKRRVP